MHKSVSIIGVYYQEAWYWILLTESSGSTFFLRLFLYVQDTSESSQEETLRNLNLSV